MTHFFPDTNYVRPQHTIRQLLDQTADATVSRISAIIVGPQYTLARYGVRELPAVTFDASAFTVPWQYVDDDGVTQTATGANVDLATAKLYAEDLEYTVLPADTVAALVVTAAEPNVVTLAGAGATTFSGGTLDANLDRAVRVGDVVYLNASAGADYRRTVTSLRGTPVAATMGTDTNLDDTYFDNGTYNPADNNATATWVDNTAALTVTTPGDFDVAANYTRGPVYNGYFGDKFYLTVTGFSGIKLQVDLTSASGLYSKTGYLSGDYGTGAYTFVGDADTGQLDFVVTVGSPPAVGTVYVGTIKGKYVRYDKASATKRASTLTSTYAGTRNTKIVFRCTATNSSSGDPTDATFWVSDTAGLITPHSASVIGDNTLTSTALTALGITVTFATTGITFLRVGDIFTIEALAATASTTEFNGLVLNGPAFDPTLGSLPTVDFLGIYGLYTGEIEAGDASDGGAWTSDASGIAVEAALSY